ncbi:hypothetical protein [Leucobacter sp. HY1910]
MEMLMSAPAPTHQELPASLVDTLLHTATRTCPPASIFWTDPEARGLRVLTRATATAAGQMLLHARADAFGHTRRVTGTGRSFDIDDVLTYFALLEEASAYAMHEHVHRPDLSAAQALTALALFEDQAAAAPTWDSSAAQALSQALRRGFALVSEPGKAAAEITLADLDYVLPDTRMSRQEPDERGGPDITPF